MAQPQLFTFAQWRILVTVIAVGIISLTIWSLCYIERSAVPEKAGSIGFEPEGSGGQRVITVASVDPRSELVRAGVVSGNRIILDRHVDAFRKLGTDETIGLTILSDSGSRHVNVRPVPSLPVIAAPWQAAAVALMGLVMTLVASTLALLIGRFRGQTTLMRILCISLYSLAWSGLYSYLPIHSPIAAFAYTFVTPFSIHIVWCGLLYVCLGVQNQHALWVRRPVRIAFWCYVALCGARSAYMLAYTLGKLPTMLDTDTVYRIFVLVPLLSGLFFSTWAVGIGWRRSTSQERQSLAWVGGLFLMVYASPAPFWLNLLLDLHIPQSLRMTISFGIFTTGLAGLTFTLFRHRVFDFSFAVNRALVFTVISTFLLIVFSITEFAVDKLLHFEGRQKNVIFDAAVALVIILSFHRIQHWVSHRIDHTFFRHWYAAAEKFRLFTARATHIADADTLQGKYLGAMQQFCSAPELTQYLRDGDKYMRTHGNVHLPTEVAFDADLAIALRHARRHLNLQAEHLGLAAEYVFPMMLRGELHGMIVLEPKADGGKYRPDEIALLAQSVAHYALDLESLRVAELEREMAALRAENTGLLGANSQLQSAAAQLMETNRNLGVAVAAFARQ